LEVYSGWFNNISKQINELKGTLSEKDYKKYKLPMLLCVAERITQFSSECGQCQMFQQDVSNIVQEVGNLVQMGNKEKQKAYSKSMNQIIGHLQRQHKLVTEGYYIGICMVIGSGIGVAFGAVMDNAAGGIPIGVGIGLAIGATLDIKAKKEGRILCPRETTSSQRSGKVLVIILGVLVLVGLVGFFLYRRLT
jgi:hypothetical protein